MSDFALDGQPLYDNEGRGFDPTPLEMRSHVVLDDCVNAIIDGCLSELCMYDEAAIARMSPEVRARLNAVKAACEASYDPFDEANSRYIDTMRREEARRSTEPPAGDMSEQPLDSVVVQQEQMEATGPLAVHEGLITPPQRVRTDRTW